METKDCTDQIKPISRRTFLTMAAATAGFLAGCQVSGQTPTATSSPTGTPLAPTHTPQPNPTATTAAQPDGPRVVRTHHAGVWEDGLLNPDALRTMLDTSITDLTGQATARDAWASLFSPDERVAIKVNTIQGSEVFTHPALVTAVTDALQENGLPAEQIVVFDRLTDELTRVGFTINRDGPGVRCYGTDGAYTAGWELVWYDIQLSNILLDCDALINMPVLKAHSMAGLSFSMKNHYGTFDRPQNFHSGEAIQRGIAELNALDPILSRSRLLIGDVLAASLIPRSYSPFWTQDVTGDSIMMGTEPVTLDTVALQVLLDMIDNSAENFQWAEAMASLWLANGVPLGLGVNDPQAIYLVERDVS